MPYFNIGFIFFIIKKATKKRQKSDKKATKRRQTADKKIGCSKKATVGAFYFGLSVPTPGRILYFQLYFGYLDDELDSLGQGFLPTQALEIFDNPGHFSKISFNPNTKNPKINRQDTSSIAFGRLSHNPSSSLSILTTMSMTSQIYMLG